MTIEHNVSLKDLCTFKIGGTAEHLARIKTREDLVSACQWATDNQVGVFVLGEGSNTIFGEGVHTQLILKIEIPGFDVIDDNLAATIVKVGAGEHWDDIVARSVDMQLASIEGLSKIPGTVGAAPVQNIGAYGQEVADALIEVEAYDLQAASFVVINRGQCNFGYRDSIFKSGQRGRYVICSVTLQLSKQGPENTGYASLQKYLQEHQITKPSHAQIREAVTAIRATKLPDPSVVPNAGSFFENPIVDKSVANDLKQRQPEMPQFSEFDKVKLSAGWMVEQCGFKGRQLGKIKVYDQNALVLTNPDSATVSDLKQARDQIIATVKDKFGITLEPEPQIIE